MQINISLLDFLSSVWVSVLKKNISVDLYFIITQAI